MMIGLKRRFGTILLVTATLGILPVISGCGELQNDPTKMTIPTNSDQWQKKLGDTFERLPEGDRGLLSRYMLRMKLSDAYESGAMPRTTIEQALVQQREYERLHPNNPTGEKSPVVANQSKGNINTQTYPITLLPVKTSDNDSLNQVKLQFVLSNHGDAAIESFSGDLLMKDSTFEQGKRFNVPAMQFEPAIVPEQSGKIIIESSIEDINVMRAIKNSQNVSVEIIKGVLTLSDGQKVEFSEQLKQ